MKKHIQHLLTTLTLSFFSTLLFGQALPPVVLCLGEDATVCQGQQVTINDCAQIGGNVGGGTAIGPYQVLNIPYAPDPWNAGTSINLSDDAVSPAQNIGFPFCFFGTTYNQFWIGSNGWIAFSAGQPATFTSAAIPSTAANVPKNCIMTPWQDWHPGVGPNVGNYIRYQVYGTAPYRRLVVSWNSVPMFSCTTTYGTFQIIIYESTNVIETHIQNKPNCLAWAGGTATHGLHNAAGTVGVIIPGRNSTQWTTTNEGYRFTPGVQWENTLGQTFPYNGGVLNITNVPPGTTGYWLTGGCGGGTGVAISDTTWITRTNSTVTASSTPDICSSGIGSVTANPGQGTAPFNFTWPALGASTQTVNNVSAGTYTVVMTDANGCPSSANVVVGDTPAQFTGSTTVVACSGGGDGTATAVMTPELGNVTYQWNDPLGQTTQTATGLSAGNYTCVVTSDIGCTGNVNVTVTEIPGVNATLVSQTDATCNSGNDGTIEYNVSSGTGPYTYSWDNSTSTNPFANDLYAGTHTLTVVDQNNCVATFSTTIGEPAPLQISQLTNDLQICPENTATLEVSGTGGSSEYTFTWFQNGVLIGTGSSIVVDPDVTNTQYCVILSEACGSPTADSCMTITFPTPIVPQLTPNQFSACIPGEFTFTNTSENGGEIATMYVLFTEGSTYMLNATDPVTITFPNSGFYGVDLTVTSVYGCVYTNTINNIVQALPLPVANFTFSANPATIFETTIMLQNSSTPDVVNWEWFSPGSTPSYSQQENPVVVFPQEVGTYPVTLMVTTAEGCMDTVEYFMNIIPAILFYAPNTFTPDGDEFNQQWEFFVSGIDIYQFNLAIFNRWGQTIWETNDPSAKWDGTYNGEIIQSGMYVWKASVKDPYSDLKNEFTGHINVLK